LLEHNPAIFCPTPLFPAKPHVACDNCFSGDAVSKFALKEGFGMALTCRCDRLPKKIPGKHLHEEKTAVNPRSKAARFLQPIVCEGLQRGWKVERPASFHRFCEKLARQMLNCDPTQRKHPGDEKFRVSTRQHKAR